MRKLIFITLTLLFVSFNVMADGDDVAQPAPVYNTTNITNTTNIQTNYCAPGVASAMAMSQVHPTWNTSRLQGGFGYGDCGGQTALSFGIAKKICDKDCPLLSVSASRENDFSAISGGINWRW